MRYFAILLAFLFAASAARADGLFMSVEAGANFSRDADLQSFNEPLPHGLPNFMWDRDRTLGTGWMVGGQGGWRFDDVGGGRLRAGVGVNYRGGLNLDNGFTWSVSKEIGRRYEIGLDVEGGQDADINSLSGSLVVGYDFLQVAYVGEGFTIYPTVGGSIGATRNSINGQRFDARATGWISDGEETYSESLSLACDAGDSNNASLAWSLEAGVGADIGPNVSAQVLGRYVDMGNVETATDYACGVSHEGEQLAAFDAKVDSEDINLTAWEVLGRLVYNF